MAISTSWVKTKVLLLVIMITPIILLGVFGSAEHNFHPLPIANSNVNGVEITMFPQNIEFEDQNNTSFNDSVLHDKIVVIGYHFINCKYKCTESSRKLMKVQYEYRKTHDVHYVQMMVGMDKNQSFDEYVSKCHINGETWHVLKPIDTSDSLLMGHRRLMIELNGEALTPGSIKHLQQMLLFDKSRRIRGYYNVSDSTDVNRLMDDIKVLKTEEWRKRDKQLNS
ncbi:MAG: hypothetical protein HRT72_07240 [Flavobacteriales bacterium]|nr:hypothetical protein [Flavobacteriales bacterium]